MTPSLLSARWTPPPARPLLLGHRGARHAAPENTLAAFELAMEEGAEGIELDVRMNASGDVIVCHDVTLERVTDGKDRRALHRLSTAECRAVRLRDGEPLPFLRDVLEWAARRHALVNIELKMDGHRRPSLVPAVVELVNRHDDPGDLLMSSFNALAVLAYRALAPSLSSAWLLEWGPAADRAWLARAGHSAVHPKHTLITAERLAHWKAHVGRVHTWTVNDPARARELAALGVDCLITDNPGAIKQALEAPQTTAPDVPSGCGATPQPELRDRHKNP